MSRRLTPVRAALPVAAMLLLSLLAAPAGAASAGAATPRVVVAMGDSITRGSVADGTRGDNAHNSWSTGSSPVVNSHVSRLAEVAGWTPTAYNVARGGTTTGDLARQAESVVTRGADYVTILSGGNDVCHATSLETLPSTKSAAADLAAALDVINQGRPDARILVASIPNMRSLHAAGVSRTAAPFVWAWTGACPIMLGGALDRSAEAENRRAAVEKHIVAMNDAMADACGRAKNCFDDDRAVFDMPVEAADVSTLDYFHPSIGGQAKIAAATWQKAVEKGVFAATPPVTIAPTIIDETSPGISWTGEWGATRSPDDSGGSVAFLASMNSGFSLTFTGTKVNVLARTTPSAGISEVRIDGALVARVDSYSPTMRFQQVIFESASLAPGTHTITVTASSDRNPASTGHGLVIDALVVETAVR